MNEIDLFIEYLINNNVNINLSLNEDKIIDDINGRLVIINYLPFFLILDVIKNINKDKFNIIRKKKPIHVSSVHACDKMK